MITLQNYEDYVIDYLEGSLSKESVQAMEIFLATHPDIQQEIEDLTEFVVVPNETIVYPDKAALLHIPQQKRRVFPFWLQKKGLAVLAIAAMLTGCIWGAQLFWQTPLAVSNLLVDTLKDTNSLLIVAPLATAQQDTTACEPNQIVQQPASKDLRTKIVSTLAVGTPLVNSPHSKAVVAIPSKPKMDDKAKQASSNNRNLAINSKEQEVNKQSIIPQKSTINKLVVSWNDQQQEKRLSLRPTITENKVAIPLDDSKSKLLSKSQPLSRNLQKERKAPQSEGFAPLPYSDLVRDSAPIQQDSIQQTTATVKTTIAALVNQPSSSSDSSKQQIAVIDWKDHLPKKALSINKQKPFLPKHQVVIILPHQTALLVQMVEKQPIIRDQQQSLITTIHESIHEPNNTHQKKSLHGVAFNHAPNQIHPSDSASKLVANMIDTSSNRRQSTVPVLATKKAMEVARKANCKQFVLRQSSIITDSKTEIPIVIPTDHQPAHPEEWVLLEEEVVLNDLANALLPKIITQQNPNPLGKKGHIRLKVTTRPSKFPLLKRLFSK